MKTVVEDLKREYKKAIAQHNSSPTDYTRGLCDGYLWALTITETKYNKGLVENRFINEINLLNSEVAALDALLMTLGLGEKSKKQMLSQKKQKALERLQNLVLTSSL